MAAPIRKYKKQKIFSFSFNFDGGLESCVRADLTNELLKYILYERQQIPFPFDQIKRELKSQQVIYALIRYVLVSVLSWLT